MSSNNIIQKFQNKKHEKLIKKIRSLGYTEEDAPTILYHIDKLSNIIIDSYINSKEK
jgi:hypothetical protein